MPRKSLDIAWTGGAGAGVPRFLPSEATETEEEREQLTRSVLGASRVDDFSYSDALALCEAGRVVSFGAGQPIFRQDAIDARSDALFLVCAGEVALEVSAGGAGSVMVGRATSGDLLGGLYLFSLRQPACSAIARSESKTLVLDRAALERVRLVRPAALERIRVALMRAALDQFRVLATYAQPCA